MNEQRLDLDYARTGWLIVTSYTQQFSWVPPKVAGSIVQRREVVSAERKKKKKMGSHT